MSLISLFPLERNIWRNHFLTSLCQALVESLRIYFYQVFGKFARSAEPREKKLARGERSTRSWRLGAKKAWYGHLLWVTSRLYGLWTPLSDILVMWTPLLSDFGVISWRKATLSVPYFMSCMLEVSVHEAPTHFSIKHTCINLLPRYISICTNTNIKSRIRNEWEQLKRCPRP